MNNDINYVINELADYAVSTDLAKESDRAYLIARLIEIFGFSDFSNQAILERRALAEILDDACDYAYENGIIKENTVTYRDLFDTSVMGALIDRPSCVIEKFYNLYNTSPIIATDYFYKLACDANYIRCDRIIRDVKWQVDSKFGKIDITINLSKPEKDPKAIAAAKLLPQSGYPKCALCHENEGYAGDLLKAARQNLRQIPIKMAGEQWYLQYSPYVYYNEQCIALSGEHKPMKIDTSTFEKLLDFITAFPHYFMGSNADLPIVGGSILSHDHMQGGRYTFAMERAPIEIPLYFSEFKNITAGIVHWPLSVIRLCGKDKLDLVKLASKILSAWQSYTDADASIFAGTKDEPHNTITPIARRRGEYYELDLALRNNLTTEEHPLGLYHPHSEHHNIKKENIGLIEVMGLAVLPARLKDETRLMHKAIIDGIPFDAINEIQKHKEWFDKFKDNYTFTAENTEKILKEEIGKTFVRVLEDAGVYKVTPEGRKAFMRFIETIR